MTWGNGSRGMQSDTLLVIGWADTIRIAEVRLRPAAPSELPKSNASGLPQQGLGLKSTSNSNNMGNYVGSNLPAPGPPSAIVPMVKFVAVVATLQVDCYLAGIAPFGKDLVVLAYLPEREDGNGEDQVAAKGHHAEQVPPLLYILASAGIYFLSKSR